MLGKYYKVAFGRLTMHQRRIRMNYLSKRILSACIDRNAFKHEDEKYLHMNKDLAVDILSLLDGIKECLEKKINIKFNDIKHDAMVPIENDTDGLIEYLNENNKEHKVAVKLLGETGVNGYRRMKDS